jgi:hypothetical protein
MTSNRAAWTVLTDAQLLAGCEVDTYRASGPGGQKRNKTDSAVRLRHLPSGLMVIAEESRSQHENKARALRRLRERLYLQLRLPFMAPMNGQSVEAPLKVGRKDDRFWPTVGLVLDALDEAQGQVSTVAAWLGASTGQLIDFLQRDETIWAQANQLRQRHGQKPLRNT